MDDVNSPPVFLPQPFSIHLPEDSSIGSSVVIVTAEDNDRGENARIDYSCEDCDKDFIINSTTGQITVEMRVSSMGQIDYRWLLHWIERLVIRIC